MNDEQPTCGKGLASSSLLPAKLGELVGALVSVLETHMEALDLGDEAGRAERDAYARLAVDYRDIAGRLLATSGLMASYHDLPMASHDMTFMTGPKPLQAFEQLVAAKRQALELLRGSVAEDEAILASMRATQRTT
jgi:hypothetical protein